MCDIFYYLSFDFCIIYFISHFLFIFAKVGTTHTHTHTLNARTFLRFTYYCSITNNEWCSGTLRQATPVTCTMYILSVTGSRLELWVQKWGFALIIFILMSRKRAFSTSCHPKWRNYTPPLYCISIKTYTCIGNWNSNSNNNSNSNTNRFQITCSASRDESIEERKTNTKIENSAQNAQKANDYGVSP